ncbi:MAG: hypothetical protein ABH950_09595, partial [Candidatus Altiarchaeota archaeon]
VKSDEILRGRLKELNCLYQISHEMNKDLQIPELFSRVASHLILGMHYPDLAAIKIDVESVSYSSKLFSKRQGAGIHVKVKSSKRETGLISAYYIKDKPFLFPYEQNMLKTVAEQIGKWIEIKKAKEEIRECQAANQDLMRKATKGIL